MLTKTPAAFVSLFALNLLLGSPIQSAVQAQTTNEVLTPIKARTIAREAYIYGFPLVDNYRVLHSYFVDRDGKQRPFDDSGTYMISQPELTRDALLIWADKWRRRFPQLR